MGKNDGMMPAFSGFGFFTAINEVFSCLSFCKGTFFAPSLLSFRFVKKRKYQSYSWSFTPPPRWGQNPYFFEAF